MSKNHGLHTNIFKVRRAILARVLDHDSAATRVIIKKLGHVINDAVDEQPAVLRSGMVGKLLWSNFSLVVGVIVGHCLK